MSAMGIGLGSIATGVATQGIGQAMQAGYSEGQMRLQQKYQNQNARYLSDLAFENWKKTNYPAQVEQMKKAGLNVGLMSSKGGQAGQSVSPTQNASSQQAGNFMGIGLDAMALQSQIELNKANANKLNADADKTREIDMEIGKVSIEGQKILNDINSLNLDIGRVTKEDQIDKWTYEVEALIKKANLDAEQAKLVKEKAVTEKSVQLLNASGIDMNNAKMNEIVHSIEQKWEQITQGNNQLIINNRANILRGQEGRAQLKKIENDFILGEARARIELSKLDIEQQKIFASLIGSVLGGFGSSTTQTYTTKDGNGKVSKTSKGY